MAFLLTGQPPAPGSVVKEQVLRRMNISQADLARAMGISTVRVNQLVNGRSPISVELALRLGRVTGTEPEYWLGVQNSFDLFRTRQRLSDTLDNLPRGNLGFGPDLGSRVPRVEQGAE